MISKRADVYRYSVDAAGADITPLAAIGITMGPQNVQVRNISTGGVALVFEKDAPLQKGEIADISISIRERAFPVQVEVRRSAGSLLNCAFVNPSRAFSSALQEFLQPKFLGENLQRNPELSHRPGAIDLVPGAVHHEAFVGQNQTAFFVWTDESREVLKLVGIRRELVFEWSREEGLRTGRLPEKSDTEEVAWDRSRETTVLHYFADILLAWFRSDEGSDFVDRVMNDRAPADGRPLRLPPV
jgi:hypothetical protein